MSNKTPFEIRADLVKLAQDHLEAQYAANIDFATQVFHTMVSNGTATMDAYKDHIPTFPTAKEILAKAAEYYEFVGKSK